jgi:hypothetical protein
MKDYFLDWKVIPKEDAIPAKMPEEHLFDPKFKPKKHESKTKDKEN